MQAFSPPSFLPGSREDSSLQESRAPVWCVKRLPRIKGVATEGFHMVHRGFRKSNHPAIIGFLLPFVSAGLASVFVLYSQVDYGSIRFRVLFIVLIPLILGLGLFLSVRSIPLIQEKGDKDYAYSGLVLNIFFILLYVFSLIYLLFFTST